MKPSAITLTRPMSAAIVHGTKRIENRPRDLPKRMRGAETIVAVHAGKGWSADYATTIGLVDTVPDAQGYLKVPYASRADDQGIVGLMTLTGRVFTSSDQARCAHLWDNYAQECVGDCACDGMNPWWSGPFGYEIASAAAFPETVPCRGMQGWWPVPDDALAAMREQATCQGADEGLRNMFHQFVCEISEFGQC